MTIEPTTETAAQPQQSPEKKMRIRAARNIGRGVWVVGYNAENPTATKEDRQAAWHEARKEFTKIGMGALRSLEKSGFEVTEKTAS